MADRPVIEIDYTNWRGVRRTRRIRVVDFIFDTSSFHPSGLQYLCIAHDADLSDDDDQAKEFAMSGIHSWRQLP